MSVAGTALSTARTATAIPSASAPGRVLGEMRVLGGIRPARRDGSRREVRLHGDPSGCGH